MFIEFKLQNGGTQLVNTNQIVSIWKSDHCTPNGTGISVVDEPSALYFSDKYDDVKSTLEVAEVESE